MNGITGYVSIMIEDHIYFNYNKLDKLRHDLHCLKCAGFGGSSSYVWNLKTLSWSSSNPMYEDRKLKMSDVERRILCEERNIKLKKLQND